MTMTIGQAIDHVLTRIKELGLERQPYCYHVSEAVYRLAGGKASGLKAMRIDRECHWFLAGPNGEIIDLTAGQFTRHTYRKLPAYSRAIGAAFYPNVSIKCKQLMAHNKSQPKCCHGNKATQCDGTCTDITRCKYPSLRIDETNALLYMESMH